MIHRKPEMIHDTKSNLRGGVGNLDFCHLLSKEELGNWATMLAAVTLQPGESVGEHPHTENGELYFVLSGSVMIAEDGVEAELFPGDAEFCAHGHTHAIRNHTDEPAVFLALIVPNP